MLQLTPAIYVTYGLLNLALLGLWLPRYRWLWPLALLAAAAAGLANHILQPMALSWAVLLAASIWRANRGSAGGIAKTVAWFVALALAGGMLFHRLPGFANPKIISYWQFGVDSLPYDKYLNFDAALIGLLVLGFGHRRLRNARQWRAMWLSAAPVALTTMIVILGLSLAAGYVHWQPKWTPLFWIWAWGNLWFTCITEEAFFRGLLQTQLTRGLAKFAYGDAWAVIIAAALFGLKHFPGGWLYVLLATVAGIGYGWAYRRSGRIEAAILTHFSVNTVHFLLFSYPALSTR